MFHSHHPKITPVLFLLLLGAAASGQTMLHLGGGYGRLAESTGLVRDGGWQLGVGHRFQQKYQINLTYFHIGGVQAVETIAGTSSREVTLHDVGLSGEYRLLQWRGFSLGSELGAGYLLIHSGAMEIDLGAFGVGNLPAQSDNRPYLGLGFNLQQAVGNLFTAYIATQWQHFQAGGTNWNYYLKGGIRASLR